MGISAFIPQLIDGNYNRFFEKLAVVVLMWFLVVVASCVDLITGIAASKRLGIFSTTSRGLRKTLTKNLSYFAVLVILLLMDVVLSYLSLKIDFFNIPICSIAGVLVIIGIEAAPQITTSCPARQGIPRSFLTSISFSFVSEALQCAFALHAAHADVCLMRTLSRIPSTCSTTPVCFMFFIVFAN